MKLKNFVLPVGILILGAISLIMVNTLVPNQLNKHLVLLIIGAAVFVTTSLVPFSKWLHHAPKLYWLSCFSLMLPFVLDHEIRETARWIKFGDFFQLQPSQLAFPLVALALIKIIKKEDISKFATQLKLGWMILIPTLLIIAAPNLSTAVFFVMILGSTLFLGGLPLKSIFTALTIMLILLGVGWLTWFKPYQKARILSFVAQTQTAQAQNYNARQALIAVGSGGLWGKGFDQGTQSKLYFLPERHTDFIFASFAEQFGFLGSLILLFIYAVITIFLIKKALEVSDRSKKLFLFFAAFILGTQTFLAVGTNIGVVPITGQTLPFISTGGSSLLSYALIFGIAQSIVTSFEPHRAIDLV